jgi:hypothetical protein
MSEHDRGTPPRSEFEQRTQQVLEAGLDRLDGRTRSRLNQARQRALDEYAAQRVSPWQRWFAPGALLPAGALAAAALVAVTLWNAPRSTEGDANFARGDAATALEDLELLASAEAGSNDDGGVDYDFYEWAAAEADAVGS